MGSNNLRPDKVEPEEELEIIVTGEDEFDDPALKDTSDDHEDDDDADDDEEDAAARPIDLAPPPEKLNEIVLEKLSTTERKLAEADYKESKRQEKQFFSEYEELKRNLAAADDAYAEAVSNADGPSATEAMRFRDRIKQQMLYMEQTWSNYQENQKAVSEQQQQEARQLEIVRSHASKWQREFGYHKYDKEAKKVIYDLDDRYAKTEAKYPTTDPRYWKGLTKYIKEHTERVGNVSAQTTRAPQERPKKEIYISKDRKEALIEAGVWDDPVLRMKYVKQYQQWDKENADLRR